MTAKIERLKCSVCRGRGYVDTFKIKLCIDCSGTGFRGYRLTEEARRNIVGLLASIDTTLVETGGQGGLSISAMQKFSIPKIREIIALLQPEEEKE